MVGVLGVAKVPAVLGQPSEYHHPGFWALRLHTHGQGQEELLGGK